MTTYVNDTPAPAAQSVASLPADVFFFDGTDLFYREAVNKNLLVSNPSIQWLDNHFGAAVDRKVLGSIPTIHFSTPAV